MNRHRLIAGALVLCAGQMAQAQGFSGAALGIDYTTSLDRADLGGVSYYAQGQADLGAGFGLGLDLSFYDFALAGSEALGVTGHVIYDLGPDLAIGGYAGRDSFNDKTVTSYGLQGAVDLGQIKAQAYLGLGDGAFDDIVALGAAGRYDFGNGIGATGGFDRVGFDGGSGLTLEIGGAYALADGPEFSAVLGRIALDDAAGRADETYLGVKARINLGRSTGTTFDRRGFFEAFGAEGS